MILIKYRQHAQQNIKHSILAKLEMPIL